MAKAKQILVPEVVRQPAKRKATSEIDDIFSNVKKPKSLQPAVDVAETVEGAGTAEGVKRKKGKKSKSKAEAAAEESNTKPQQVGEDKVGTVTRKAPVEIIDTSKAIEAYKPEPVPVRTALGADATDAERKAAEEEERFMDSRGTRRKTDDGLPIYDTAELRIGLGGDTELCPFDCDCCF
ncbi:hypothetical protein JCM11641_002669 [Rhodosporidiobolus odoratus]